LFNSIVYPALPRGFSRKIREAFRDAIVDACFMNALMSKKNFRETEHLSRDADRRVDWPRVLLDTCRRIERAEREPSLAVLAEAVGVSASELQRQFSQRLGVSPKSYGQALKLHRLADRVNRGRNTLDATFAAGFESPTRAYATASAAFGTSPGKLRDAMELGAWLGLSDLGWMLMAASERGVCWLSFGDDPDALQAELRATFPKAVFRGDETRLRDWFDRVRDHVLLPAAALDLPVDIQGTAFQSKVWRALRRIPLGQTRSYSQLASELGQPGAARAVASACARNRVALLIPCHRVIGRDGALAGYRWGVSRKGRLLAGEAAATA
jgi:AraC family transcriptional regulator of adaptative response/methylated-DNA-[protein]-cysteine methyltransferase